MSTRNRNAKDTSVLNQATAGRGTLKAELNLEIPFTYFAHFAVEVQRPDLGRSLRWAELIHYVRIKKIHAN